MSSETDSSRQRTVAELVAEHGDSGAASRRRRRRQADQPDERVAPPEPAGGAAFPPLAEQRAASPPLRDRAEWSPPVQAQGAARPPAPPVADRRPERPTEEIPRVRDLRTAAPDECLTGPIPRLPAAAGPDGGPATMIGAAPAGSEGWHGARTADSGRAVAPSEGGPPTQAAPFEVDDDPVAPDPGDPDFADDLDDLESADDAGDPDDGDPDDDDLDDDALEPQPQRSPSRGAAGSSGQAWAAVVAQWIAGAIGGAALWVGFRFLWRELPVVAIAAAVLVTVGLVVIVRTLLRNDDTRTTVFAVLVGLLLTVSPAILVLIGR